MQYYIQSNPSTAYAPGTQIINPGIVNNSGDHFYKSFGISSNMMKIKYRIICI